MEPDQGGGSEGLAGEVWDEYMAPSIQDAIQYVLHDSPHVGSVKGGPDGYVDPNGGRHEGWGDAELSALGDPNMTDPLGPKVGQIIPGKLVQIVSIERIPTQPDEEPGMPSFIVKGSFQGQPFEIKMSLELDGRDMDSECISGVDVFEVDADDELFKAQEEIFDAVYKSPGYAEALAEFEAHNKEKYKDYKPGDVIQPPKTAQVQPPKPGYTEQGTPADDTLAQVSITKVTGRPVTTQVEAMIAAKLVNPQVPYVEEVQADVGVWIINFTPELIQKLLQEGQIEMTLNGYHIVAEMP
jgi:hypothetical protein